MCMLVNFISLKNKKNFTVSNYLVTFKVFIYLGMLLILVPGTNFKSLKIQALLLEVQSLLTSLLGGLKHTSNISKLQEML